MELKKGIHNMTRILYPEFKGKIMLVDHENLMIDTEKEIKGIYNFLGIEYFNADLSNLSTPHEYTDTWGVKNHHKVKKEIPQEEYNLEEIFLPSTIKQYSNLEFWKK